MKAQAVILRAMSKQISFGSRRPRFCGWVRGSLRRLYQRYRRYGYDGMYDRRTGQPSPRRVKFAVVEQVLAYQEKYRK